MVDGAVGRDVLPAVGKSTGDIGRSNRMTDKYAGLKQSDRPGAAVDDAEIGAAAGQGKTGNAARREDVVGAGRHAEHAAGASFDPVAVVPLVVCEPPKPEAHTLQRGS